jgi:hypothetical protein
MKTFKNLFLAFLTAIVAIQLLIMHDLFAMAGELQIRNYSSTNIYVTVVPVGAIFNGNGEKKYKLKSGEDPEPSASHLYLFGTNKIVLPNGGDLRFSFDGAGERDTDGAIGYGLYRIRIYPNVRPDTVNEETISVVQCFVDYSDADYYTSNWNLYNDIVIDYFNNGVLLWGTAPAPSLIQVWDQRQLNPNFLKTRNKDGFKSDDSGDLRWKDYPISASALFPGKVHIDPQNVSVNLKIQDQDMKLLENKALNFNDANLIIENGKIFEIGNNATINFIGNSTFKTNHTSLTNFNIGSGSVININQNSKAELNYTNFTSSSGTWQGIKLTNPLSSIINACTFNNSEKPLSIINDNSYYANIKHHITNNTFTLPQGTYNSGTCFTGRNLFKINFQNNTLNGHTSNTGDRGIYFSNLISPSHPTGDGEGAGATESYDLKFTGNTIHNLSLGVLFINSASSLAEINFMNNNYTGSKSSMVYGLNAIKTIGNFKNNKFLQSGSYYNF